ncbi:hypothetical protein FB45DRAFT_890842 [Roridomyces roridus]|uniref:Cytochrome b561 domain-containing protein n=1 Tax=Roridomyces roridus TaxID=1738132 RepID=A0AAD7CDV1_9AGAR|nr:hypothetical protein FB45DRAFT_890842 [Roridomyces roridus]
MIPLLVASLFTLVSASALSSPDFARRDLTGDAKCSGVHTLSSTGARPTGWMAVGFGTQMRNTPMVIMWANSDGSITLSQRKAPGETMPKLDSDPPRVATLQTALSATTDNPSFVFTIPANDDTNQKLIYAFGGTNPGSADPEATLIMHINYGFATLDLTKPVDAPETTTTPTASGPSATATSKPSRPVIPIDDPTDDIPYTPYQRKIIAHAVLCSLGFALLLPAGALLARYLRTFTPVWYTGHWIAQFAVAGPAILAGVALGFNASAQTGAVYMNTHKRTGITLFVLYLFQCFLGAFIHYVKPKNSSRRPAQNYAHAILGLIILAVALAQVRSGYHTEWPGYTGLGDAPGWVNALWIVWVIALPLLYAAGLSLLPKQHAQEAAQRKKMLAIRMAQDPAQYVWDEPQQEDTTPRAT